MRKLLSIALIICVGISTLSLTACNGKTDPQTPSDTENTTLSSKETEETSKETEDTEPVTSEPEEGSDNSVVPAISDSIYPLRQRVMEAAAFMAQENILSPDDLCYLTFTYKPDEKHPSQKLEEADPRVLPYEDGNLKVDVNLLCFPIDRSSECTYQVTMLCIINGKVYDFKVGDRKSTNGVLTMDLAADTDFAESLDISGIPVKKGENKFCFMAAFYSPEKDRYYYTNAINGGFNSDSETDGISPVDAATEKMVKGIEIKTTEGLSGDAVRYPRIPLKVVKDEDVLELMDDDRDYLTVKTDAVIYHELLNCNNDYGPANRKGILLAISDGKIIPVFGGKEILYVGMDDKTLHKSIPLDNVFKGGKTYNLQLIYVEFDNDSDYGPADALEDDIKILFKD